MDETYIQSEFDGTRLSVAARRVDSPRGILQISHGMAEHKERYYGFMEYLAARGIASLIMDHRGHGGSVADRAYLGYFGERGADGVVFDMAQLARAIREEYPGVPLIMLAHSMGALAGRAYIQQHGDLLAGLVVSGNPGYNASAPAGVRIAKFVQKRRSARAMCKPLTWGMFSPFVLKSRGFSTMNGWVCGDSAVVRAYDEDPLCGFEFTANGYEALLTLMARAYDPKAPAPNRDLPVAFFSGAKDPVMAGERALRRAAQLLTNAGYRSVEVKLYPGLRHEIMNERGKQAVWRDMAEKIDQWIALTHPAHERIMR